MSDTDNVINLPTPRSVLADRIRVAFTRTDRNDQQWIEDTLDMASALAEARATFKADREFSIWIIDEGLQGITADDRAALINMADDLRMARIVLEETDRRSWRYIWEHEMKLRFRYVAKPNLPTADFEKPPSIPEPEVKVPSENTPPGVETKSVSRRSPFHGWERADEVVAIYRDKDARSVIGKAINDKGGKDIIAEHRIISNVQHVKHLPPSWGTLYELTRLPDETLIAGLKDGSIHPKLERKDVRSFALTPSALWFGLYRHRSGGFRCSAHLT